MTDDSSPAENESMVVFEFAVPAETFISSAIIGAEVFRASDISAWMICRSMSSRWWLTVGPVAGGSVSARDAQRPPRGPTAAIESRCVSYLTLPVGT